MPEQEIDKIIHSFAEFLTNAWPHIAWIAEEVEVDNYLNDWLQANWETFVEGALNPPGQVFLEVYGEGADCNSRSSRVYRPSVDATHEVVCIASMKARSVTDLLHEEQFDLGTCGMALEELVTFDGSWYSRKPPFNCVLLDDNGRYRAVCIDSIVFKLRPVVPKHDCV